MRKESKHKKKYPIFTYLCYLLAVCILITGVTFARYSSVIRQTGDVNTAPFNCSYEIENISSFGFGNTGYWIQGGTVSVGTSRTVRFTMRNYTGTGDDRRVTGVAVQGSMRFYLPAVLADNLALQFRHDTTSSDNIENYTTVTPQVVLGELIYGNFSEYYSQSDETDETVALSYNDYGVGENFTADELAADKVFGGYEGLTYDVTAAYAEEEGGTAASEWTAKGSLAPSYGENRSVTLTETVTVKNEDGNVIKSFRGLQLTITAGTGLLDYSVGFRRGDVESPLYLDLQRETTFYSIDVTLPTMVLEGNTPDSATHVAYLTLTQRVQNNLTWQKDFAEFLINPTQNDFWVHESGNYLIYDITNIPDSITIIDTSGDEQIIEPDTDSSKYYKITIVGYHFEQSAPLGGSDETTTVRIKCEYATNEEGQMVDKDGNALQGGAVGCYNVSLYHVAPIEKGGVHFVHALTVDSSISEKLQGINYSAGNLADILGVEELTGADSSENGHIVDLSDIKMSPFDGTAQGGISEAISRSFYMRITARFVQASSVPGGIYEG